MMKTIKEIYEAESKHAEAVGKYRAAFYNRKIVLNRLIVDARSGVDEKGKRMPQAEADSLARASAAYIAVVQEECSAEEAMLKAAAEVGKLKREYELPPEVRNG